MKVTAVYRSALNKSILATTKLLEVGKFVEIGRRTIVAQEGISLGYGSLAGQDAAVARIFMDIQKAGPAAVDGTIRIELRNAHDRPIATVFEARTEQLRTMVTAPSENQKMPFPEMQEMVTEDNSIVILMNGDTADTITKADSKFLMDITSYDLKS